MSDTKERKNSESIFSLISKFGFNSVFVRTLLFMLVFSAVMLFAVLSYSYYTVRQNARERLELRTESVLEKTQETVDREFESLNSQLRLLLNDDALRAVMTAPNLTNDERNYRVVTQMESVTLLNESVSDIYLYIPTIDQILVGSGLVSKTEVISRNSDLFKLIEVMKRQFVKGVPGNKELVFIGDRLYMMITAPVWYNRILGVLSFEIDLKHLYEMINGVSAETRDDIIYVYGPDDRRVFSSFCDYPDEIDDNYRVSISPANSWIYCLHSNADLFSGASPFSDRLFVYLIAAMTAFCILFSLFLSHHVYRPISSLVHITENAQEDSFVYEDQDRRTARGNELELLQNNIYDTIMKNRELHRMIEVIRPQMVTSVFRRLLLGNEISKESFDNGLAVLQSGFRSRLNYSLYLIAMFSDEPEVTELELNAILQEYKSMIYEYSAGRFQCCFIDQLDHCETDIVLGTGESISQDMIAQWYKELGAMMDKISIPEGVHYYIGHSKEPVYYTDLYSAFQKLKKGLRKQYYKGFGQETDEPGIHPETRDQLDQPEREYLSGLYKTLRDNVESEDAALSFDFVNTSLRTLIENAGSAEKAHQILSFWWDKAAADVVNLEEYNRSAFYEYGETGIRTLKDTDKLISELVYFNRFISDVLKDSQSRNNRKYAERAVDYIHEHYSDASISLGTLAELLGISQSYLSTQFKKSMGQSFVDYLNEYRVSQSCWLLRMTEITVEDIGFRCGFSNSKSFIRVFKKYRDLTPGEYRKTYANI